MSFVGDMKGRAGEVADRLLTATGFAHSESRLAADAKAYWTQADDDTWLNNTHIHTGSAMTENDTWERVGKQHLALFEQMAKMVDQRRAIGRAVEWGVGGGSNAVAFAPYVKEFIGIDISDRIVAEAAHQVQQRTDARFLPMVVDLENPESIEAYIPFPVDLFLCLYVLELVPSPAYGIRVMKIAYKLLGQGGLAFVQIKYDTGRWNTRSRGRNYKGWRAASQTSYRIDEFWTLMQDVGFEPLPVHLIPQNDLDERYAYFLLRKP